MSGILLRNGATEDSGIVAVVMVTITRMFDSGTTGDHLALYDFASHANDRTYDLSFTEKTLRERGLLDVNGVMHTSVRNVAASAIVVNGLDPTLRDPAKTD